jgi:hypothetical protein
MPLAGEASSRDGHYRHATPLGGSQNVQAAETNRCRAGGLFWRVRHADNKEIAQVLRAGGFVIVFRHGASFPNQADTDRLNFDDIAAQRNLNDKVNVLAKAFGDAIL